jgi:very-short-patch-repair endonuclease
MKSKISQKDYEEICNKKHNNKYDYSLADISNNKIKIICPIHGEFLQNKYSHKLGMGCWKCSVEFRSELQTLGKDKFVKKSIEVHGDVYNYDLVNYKNNNTKVKIICHRHGEYKQTPSSHLSGNGCPMCGTESMVRKQSHNTEKFIEKSINIHGNKYDYSKVNYINNRSKVTIICKRHGDFLITAGYHLNEHGCKKCDGIITNVIDLIEKANTIHNNKYDYSLVEYKNSNSRIKIICKKHGIFIQKVNNHLNQKQGCPMCYTKTIKSNTTDFIEKSMKSHIGRYDYSLVDYKNAKTDVSIICKKHGIFKQQPTHHLSGKGCPICKSSKGENRIFNILTFRNIKFEHHFVFDNFNLEFDFYLPDHNVCIEYDGIQHFKPINHFGGEKAFIDQVRRDKEKDEYCYVNNIHLLRIPYNEKNIDFSILISSIVENISL